MINFPVLSLADRILMTLEGLYRAVAARSAPRWMGREPLAVSVILLVCQRVRRIEGRLLGMLARFQAGRLVVRPMGTRVAGCSGQRMAAAAAGLPRRFGWLLPMVPCEAANLASQFRQQLADPQIQALLKAAPQARRMLAPLCRMLAIEASVLTPAVGAIRPAAMPGAFEEFGPAVMADGVGGSVRRRVPDD